MRIDRMMVREPVTVPPATSIQRTAQLMHEHGVGSIVVTDHDRVVGIVTDRDLVTRALAVNAPLDGRVDSVMTMDVVTLDADTDLRDVVRAFGRHAVRRIPLTTDGRVSGLVSLDDMLAANAQQVAELTNGLVAQLLFPHAGDEPPVPARVEASGG